MLDSVVGTLCYCDGLLWYRFGVLLLLVDGVFSFGFYVVCVSVRVFMLSS